MILTVANTKGGVGKTTLAVNLAIAAVRAGRDVLLIDGDDQATALTFTNFRSERGVHDFTVCVRATTWLTQTTVGATGFAPRLRV